MEGHMTVKLNCEKDSAEKRGFSHDTTVSSHTEWDHGPRAKNVSYSEGFKGIHPTENLKTRRPENVIFCDLGIDIQFW